MYFIPSSNVCVSQWTSYGPFTIEKGHMRRGGKKTRTNGRMWRDRISRGRMVREVKGKTVWMEKKGRRYEIEKGHKQRKREKCELDKWFIIHICWLLCRMFYNPASESKDNSLPCMVTAWWHVKKDCSKNFVLIF